MCHQVMFSAQIRPLVLGKLSEEQYKKMISVYLQRNDLVEKHRNLLDKLRWIDENQVCPEPVRAFPCNLNCGITLKSGDLSPMIANIYVNDILATAAFRENMTKLLAAIIKAIFAICRTLNIAVRQCPLSLKKWHKSIIQPRQIILGLVVDTNRMMVGITNEYIQKVRNLLELRDPNWRFFKVNDMQKLVGKLA